MIKCVLPWYNCSGSLDVKHQVTYLLSVCPSLCLSRLCLSVCVCLSVTVSVCLSVSVSVSVSLSLCLSVSLSLSLSVERGGLEYSFSGLAYSHEFCCFHFCLIVGSLVFLSSAVLWEVYVTCVMINNSAVYKPVSFRSDGTFAVLWPYFQGKH